MLSLGAGGKWFPDTGTNTQHCLLLAPAPEVERLGVGGWGRGEEGCSLVGRIDKGHCIFQK